MGVLRGTKSGTLHHLPSRVIVGRSTSCRLQVDEPLASAEHAAIAWTGGCWEVRDLASTNGTFVDGERLASGASAALREGSEVGFGAANAYVLADASEPQPLARLLTRGETLSGEHGLLVLPDEATPAASVYRDEAGVWTLELDSESKPVTDQAVIAVHGDVYQLDLPELTEATPMAMQTTALGAVDLTFFVDRAEEHVGLKLGFGVHEVEFEPRDHQYVLLVLARIRRDDADRPERERGWVDREALLRMVALSENAFNVAVHRARKQFVQAGVEDGARIVETRPNQRRLGTDRVTIVTEDH